MRGPVLKQVCRRYACRLPVGDTADNLSALPLARPAAGVAQVGNLRAGETIDAFKFSGALDSK